MKLAAVALAIASIFLGCALFGVGPGHRPTATGPAAIVLGGVPAGQSASDPSSLSGSLGIPTETTETPGGPDVQQVGRDVQSVSLAQLISPRGPTVLALGRSLATPAAIPLVDAPTSQAPTPADAGADTPAPKVDLPAPAPAGFGPVVQPAVAPPPPSAPSTSPSPTTQPSPPAPSPSPSIAISPPPVTTQPPTPTVVPSPGALQILLNRLFGR